MFRIAFILMLIKIDLIAQINFNAYQDSINFLSSIAVKGDGIEKRNKASEQLVKMLSYVLAQEGSFSFPFDSVKSLAVLNSSDNSFRLFNWNEIQEDGTYKYYGLIQKYDKKNKKSKVFVLNDDQRDKDIAVVEKTSLVYPHWYGAHYYEIIYTKKGKSKYYTLLGWEGKDRLATCKVIDVLQFDRDGPVFGAPIFAYAPIMRIVFEYSNQVSMSLKYDAKKKQIIYDHLSPSRPEYLGNYAYYGPDMSYDALVYKKGKWILIEDVKPKNSKK